MTESTKLQNLAATEVDALSEAFADWPKPRSLFERYAAMAAAGERDVVVAWSGERSVGYLTIAWTSPYQPFAVAGIPEVVDFNVAARQRNRGMGHALMDEAERRIRIRAEFAGIGVGLTAGYGAAQRMYVKRGYLPAGRAIVVDGEPVAPGSMIVVDDSSS